MMQGEAGCACSHSFYDLFGDYTGGSVTVHLGFGISLYRRGRVSRPSAQMWDNGTGNPSPTKSYISYTNQHAKYQFTALIRRKYHALQPNAPTTKPLFTESLHLYMTF